MVSKKLSKLANPAAASLIPWASYNILRSRDRKLRYGHRLKECFGCLRMQADWILDHFCVTSSGTTNRVDH